MDIAHVMSMRSKDRSTQVGACLVSPDRRQIAVGYNGLPQYVPDHPGVLDKTRKFIPFSGPDGSSGYTTVDMGDARQGLGKHDLVVHAELNAILNCHVRPEGWTLYVTHIPCVSICVRHIIAAGISRVVAMNRTGQTDLGCDQTAWAFKLAQVEFNLLSE